jgi:predicted MPP superfamily phosphohydrolase
VENWGKPPFPRYGDLAEATNNFEPAQFNILLSHDPNHWKSEVSIDERYKYINLTLSGHTHSAQIGIDLGNFKWSPSQWIFEYWDGLYEKDGQYLFVSRGLGYVGIPFRLGMPAEISVITMKNDH